MRLPWNDSSDLPELDADVARLLAAAGAPAQPGELAGEGAAVAAFAAAGATAPVLTPERTPLRKRRVTARLATIVAAGGLGLSTLGAAYAGALPETPQNIAGTVLAPLGVPKHAKSHGKGKDKSAEAKAKASKTPEAGDEDGKVGPDANGEAKKGLCNAWAASGKPKNPNATSFANLVEAAGGVDNVEAFCADVAKSPKPEQSPKPEKSPKPSKSSDPSETPDDDGTPKPSKTASPGSQGQGEEHGKPSDVPRNERSANAEEHKDGT